MDLKNPAGEARNLCVDQYGTVSEFCSDSGGMAGAIGPMGPAGPMGAQGPAGAVGAQAKAVGAKEWQSFRDFLFDFDKSDIRSNETSHVSDIAGYLKQNPTARVGIDGHADPRGTDPYNQGLSERRVNNISAALVSAGVATNRIHTGAFGETQTKCKDATETCWQSDRRVEVLIGTIDTASR
jgi:peptidoglycan-associated lipoprotein